MLVPYILTRRQGLLAQDQATAAAIGCTVVLPMRRSSQRAVLGLAYVGGVASALAQTPSHGESYTTVLRSSHPFRVRYSTTQLVTDTQILHTVTSMSNAFPFTGKDTLDLPLSLPNSNLAISGQGFLLVSTPPSHCEGAYRQHSFTSQASVVGVSPSLRLSAQVYPRAKYLDEGPLECSAQSETAKRVDEPALVTTM